MKNGTIVPRQRFYRCLKVKNTKNPIEFIDNYSVCDVEVSILRPRISQHVLRVDESTSVDVLPDSRSVHYDLPSEGAVCIGGLPPAAETEASRSRIHDPQAPPILGRRLHQPPDVDAPPYLPKQIRSRGLGYQGCIGSLDLNGDRWRLAQRLDDVPAEHRDDIVKGCHGTHAALFHTSCTLMQFKPRVISMGTRGNTAPTVKVFKNALWTGN